MPDHQPTIDESDLRTIYAKAMRFKDSVYRKWIDNLAVHALNSGNPDGQSEAIRRIDFIESNMLRAA
jgi:hypothetical protein